jgi:hypothetical protein
MFTRFASASILSASAKCSLIHVIGCKLARSELERHAEVWLVVAGIHNAADRRQLERYGEVLRRIRGGCLVRHCDLLSRLHHDVRGRLRLRTFPNSELKSDCLISRYCVFYFIFVYLSQ